MSLETLELHLIEKPSDIGRDTLLAFALLLQEAVESGASLGYLYQSDFDTYEKFWRDEIKNLNPVAGFIVYATLDDTVVGVVQCAFATKQTGSHRAEVRKLLVKKSVQGKGIATQLMMALEEHALESGRTLLYLDTERGSGADFLYPKLGWTAFGVIPHYAASPNGILADCTFYYKSLTDD